MAVAREAAGREAVGTELVVLGEVHLEGVAVLVVELVAMTVALQEANKYLLNTSVYLVHWQGGSTKSVFKNIWMFYNEIELLSKVGSSRELKKENLK